MFKLPKGKATKLSKPFKAYEDGGKVEADIDRQAAAGRNDPQMSNFTDDVKIASKAQNTTERKIDASAASGRVARQPADYLADSRIKYGQKRKGD